MAAFFIKLAAAFIIILAVRAQIVSRAGSPRPNLAAGIGTRLGRKQYPCSSAQAETCKKPDHIGGAVVAHAVVSALYCRSVTGDAAPTTPAESGQTRLCH